MLMEGDAGRDVRRTVSKRQTSLAAMLRTLLRVRCGVQPCPWALRDGPQRVTMFYCPSCRQNLDASIKKSHNYQPLHKKWRDDLLAKVTARVSESRFFLKNIMRSRPGLELAFSCPFCEEEIDQSKNKTIWFVLLSSLVVAAALLIASFTLS